MKVLKFGGSSVGSRQGLLNIRSIVEEEVSDTIVVVSALGGVTDMLIDTARKAASRDDSYLEMMEAITRRHHNIIAEVTSGDNTHLLHFTDTLLHELELIFRGLYLIGDLSEKTLALIVSYGERLSAPIVTAVIPGSKLHDSRTFIKTICKHGRTLLAVNDTYRLVREEFIQENGSVSSVRGVHIVPGFISTDIKTNEISNLGRGGSDYTASIICAALEGDELQIWTDVDGFMTADPRVVDTAYTISTLSYQEAMELSNFGAKVIYPPTIYPVCIKRIPIIVKNTYKKNYPGTLIMSETPVDLKPIKGISSIDGVALITVSGLSMVGVIGVNRRIFTALANNGISVFMVSQASSENSTSVGVREIDADKAVEVLDEEFAKEIATGAMFPMHAQKGLATLAIVGENMKTTPGVAGKLYGALGRSGINVISSAQGANSTNISCTIDSGMLRKALNVIHDSFFLSEYKELNLFVCGIGTVGGRLLEQIRLQREELMRTHRLKINVVGIASSKHAIFSREGIDLNTYREILNDSPLSNTQSMAEEILKMNIFNSVFVDCTASAEVAGIYARILEHNISVVAANKIAASGPYSNYRYLKDLALSRGIKFLYEANVGAGLPIIGTINDLRAAGDRILKIEAVVSGTLNYIFNTLSEEKPLSKVVRMAQEAGYSEPDPRIDLSGIDVVRKLVILTREAGYEVETGDVEKHLFIPEEYFSGTLEEFEKKLPSLDVEFENKRKEIEKESRRWCFVARMEEGKMSVGLQAVEATSPSYSLEGSNNIVLLTTERYREYPMMIRGYGAGADVTAAGVFANIISIASK